MTTRRIDPTGCKIAVIIPYYQEESGILREAVLSAIAQEGVGDLEIIVVDDGSPAPARNDLQALELPPHATLKLIEQQNGGPGAARNRGLDDLSPDTVYVALLDSDDTWTADHLLRAQMALQAGHDFYFSDYEYSETGETIFSVRGASLFDDVRPIAQSALRTLTGDCTLYVLRGCIAVPTIVYRRKPFDSVRFPEQFRVGEDRAFLLGLTCRQGVSVAFSSRVECYSRQGLHIFKNSRWGSPEIISSLTEWIHSKKWICDNIKLDANAEKIHLNDMEIIRRGFILSVLHSAKKRSLRYSDIWRYMRSDPIVITRFPSVVVEVIMNRTKTALLSS
jgi:succinoglycan biosynthesis protein ExoW